MQTNGKNPHPALSLGEGKFEAKFSPEHSNDGEGSKRLDGVKPKIK